MYQGIPIIGIVGGIGSGKSHVARIFGRLGCLVINSDEQVTAVYTQPEIRDAIRQRWGDEMFLPDGTLDRKRLAARVFASAQERALLEQLVHPAVATLRDVAMRRAAESPIPPVAFVWDTPLLFEAGIAGQCDAIVFVDAPESVRLERVRQTRGWDATELNRRENSQSPLDKKRALSHYVISNVANEADSIPAPPIHPQPTVVRSPEAAVDGDVVNGTGVSRPDLCSQVRSVLDRVLASVAVDGTD